MSDDNLESLVQKRFFWDDFACRGGGGLVVVVGVVERVDMKSVQDVTVSYRESETGVRSMSMNIDVLREGGDRMILLREKSVMASREDILDSSSKDNKKVSASDG